MTAVNDEYYDAVEGWAYIKRAQARLRSISKQVESYRKKPAARGGRRAKEPEKLSAADESLLLWYYEHGTVAFERSNFGVALERAKQSATGSRTCINCKGAGLVQTHVRTCIDCGGDGIIGLSDPMTAVRCPTCDGRKYVELTGREKLVKSYEVVDFCMKCRGLGVVQSPRKIWTRRECTHQLAEEPNQYDIERYGTAVRRLVKISESSAAVLWAYYWVGSNHADNRNEGRLWPVMALTPAGKRLIRQYAGRRPAVISCRPERKQWAELTQPELFQELDRLPWVGGSEDAKRVKLLKEARKQAQALYDAAVADWNSHGPACKASNSVQAKLDRMRTAVRAGRRVIYPNPEMVG